MTLKERFEQIGRYAWWYHALFFVSSGLGLLNPVAWLLLSFTNHSTVWCIAMLGVQLPLFWAWRWTNRRGHALTDAFIETLNTDNERWLLELQRELLLRTLRRRAFQLFCRENEGR